MYMQCYNIQNQNIYQKNVDNSKALCEVRSGCYDNYG